MQVINKNKKQLLLAVTLLFSLSISSAAKATLVDLTLVANWAKTDYTVTGLSDPLYDRTDPNVDGKVFGVIPSDGSLTIQLRVNTENSLFFNAGHTYTHSSGQTLTLAHDYYGYTDVTLQNEPLTFGTASWVNNRLLTQLDGPSSTTAEIWTDGDIINDSASRISIRLGGDGDGLDADFFIGRSGESIQTNFLLWEYFGEGIRTPLGSGSYTISTSVVPVPAAVWLFGTGFLGLIGFSANRKRGLQKIS